MRRHESYYPYTSGAMDVGKVLNDMGLRFDPVEKNRFIVEEDYDHNITLRSEIIVTSVRGEPTTLDIYDYRGGSKFRVDKGISIESLIKWLQRNANMHQDRPRSVEATYRRSESNRNRPRRYESSNDPIMESQFIRMVKNGTWSHKQLDFRVASDTKYPASDIANISRILKGKVSIESKLDDVILRYTEFYTVTITDSTHIDTVPFSFEVKEVEIIDNDLFTLDKYDITSIMSGLVKNGYFKKGVSVDYSEVLDKIDISRFGWD